VHKLRRYLLAGQHAWNDRLPPAASVAPLDAHLRAARDWLCRAQDATPDGGVAACFHLKDGWAASYPETTGYIAESFFREAERTGESAWRDRAGRMTDWLLTRQHADGGFPGLFGDRATGPTVFNTGQILFGLLAALRHEPARADVRSAIHRAATWLAAVQDADGCWRRHTFNDRPHAYNTRTAWALLLAGHELGDAAFESAAERNLDWTLQQQADDGWFHYAAFDATSPPFLHTIAYTLRGLIEAGWLSGNRRCIAAARRPARRLAYELVDAGRLAGAYGHNWVPVGRYRCLTGEAQLAALWCRLHEVTGEAIYYTAAERAIRFVASTQRLDGPPEIRGAIAGCYPIWGGYSRFEFPNWAAKFFLDAVVHFLALPEPAASEISLCASAY
jgi:hypothetical protein